MPQQLPDAPADTRELASRPDGDGFDTQVARFFGADVANEEEVDTLIDAPPEMARAARDRIRERQRALDTRPMGR